MPLITARLSLAAARCQLHGLVWRSISLFAPGALASEDWTDAFIHFAREFRPPCEYEELEGVVGVMFDNYTRRVLYSSQRTVESGGYLLNMTNSASMKIPKLLAGPNFDAKELCEAQPWNAPHHHKTLLNLAGCHAQGRILCGRSRWLSSPRNSSSRIQKSNQTNPNDSLSCFVRMQLAHCLSAPL